MQAELGDIVYVELPEAGSEVEKGSNFGVVESVKVSGNADCFMSSSDACSDIVCCQGCVRGWQYPVLLSLLVLSTAVLNKDRNDVLHDSNEDGNVQAASDVYSPISGEVLESNQGLADEPGKVGMCCICCKWSLSPKTDSIA